MAVAGAAPSYARGYGARLPWTLAGRGEQIYPRLLPRGSDATRRKLAEVRHIQHVSSGGSVDMGTSNHVSAQSGIQLAWARRSDGGFLSLGDAILSAAAR